ncbi:MAG: hypothetical protein GY869_16705, partial [Planctomycetes bacterium]|nr:hypothetical protein [Planctomycetota bacterium]
MYRTRQRRIGTVGMMLVVCLGAINMAQGQIKLVALPERAATVIRLDNPQFTLIEEERTLTLQQGINKVDFSWQGVSIDEDSIRLAILGHPDQVTLLNVSYPQSGQSLWWEINSTAAAEEKVRISYLLGNIDRLITYKAVADKEETAVDLKSYIILRNFSGEDFEKAQVKLDYGDSFEQGIKHEETKQLLFLNKLAVPIQKVWMFDARTSVWDPEKVPDQNVGIPVKYRILNTIANKLGEFSLWGGKVRLFQDDGYGSTIMLGEDNAALIPVGEKMELHIGDSRDIVVTQRLMSQQDINIRPSISSKLLWDRDVVIEAKIENFKDKPAVLTMIQSIPGEWEMIECNMEYVKKDANTLTFEVELPA